MAVDVGYVIEVEGDGLRKLYGPVVGFANADATATGMRKVDTSAVIRVHRLNSLESSRPARLPVHISPNQTTIDDHIPDIHDHIE